MMLFSKKQYWILLAITIGLNILYLALKQTFILTGTPTDIVTKPLSLGERLSWYYTRFGAVFFLLVSFMYEHYAKEKKIVFPFFMSLNFLGYEMLWYSFVAYASLFVATLGLMWKKHGQIVGFCMANIAVISCQQIWELPIEIVAHTRLPHILWFSRYLARHSATIIIIGGILFKHAYPTKKFYLLLLAAIVLDVTWTFTTWNRVVSGSIGPFLRLIWATLHIYLIWKICHPKKESV